MISQLDIPPQKAIELLKKQYRKGKSLLAKPPVSEGAFTSWENTTKDLLVKIFGENSINVNSVMEIGRHGIFPVSPTERYMEDHRAKSLEKKIFAIDGLIELLRTEINARTEKPTKGKADTVFLVHGHEIGVKETVARYLERLNLKVVILHEQPNEGRTIIEKFVDYSDVGFAVVLLTADDQGGKINLPIEKQTPRARQNVILELGYFLGKLGRKRVCALYQEGVEIPSDYQGVLFLVLDDMGAWKLQLARELKAVGMQIDLNMAV